MSTTLIDRTKAADYCFAPPDFDEEEEGRTPNAELLEAMEDVRLGRNLYGPFATAEEAVRSMLED